MTHKSTPIEETETVIRNDVISLAALKPHPRNYRSHPDLQIERLGASLQQFSQYRSIVVQSQSDGSYLLVAGHGLAEAAKRNGMTHLRADVLPADLDAATVTAILVADNLSSATAEDDDAALAQLLEESKQSGIALEAMGFSDAALEALLADLANEALDNEGTHRDPDDPSGGGDDFDATPPEGPTRTQRGDVWALGEHRVMCGDSTNADDVLRLLDGHRIDLVFTDPPYNCADEMSAAFYAGSDSPAMRELSHTTWDQGFDISAFLVVLSRVRPQNGTVYICTSHMLAPLIWQWMQEQKATLDGFCVWVKPNPMPSLAKRHPTWATELICYATFGKHVFNFPEMGHALNWWEITANSANRLHPTQKPLGVPLRAIAYSSNPHALVFDGFLGSGTTLIACDRLGRVCYSMEREQKYCDVAIARWEKESGSTATLLYRLAAVE